VIDYDDAFVATELEAPRGSGEVVGKAKEFVGVVEQWIAKNHQTLKAKSNGPAGAIVCNPA